MQNPQSREQRAKSREPRRQAQSKHRRGAAALAARGSTREKTPRRRRGAERGGRWRDRVAGGAEKEREQRGEVVGAVGRTRGEREQTGEGGSAVGGPERNKSRGGRSTAQEQRERRRRTSIRWQRWQDGRKPGRARFCGEGGAMWEPEP